MTLALFNLITASLFVYVRGMFFHLGGGGPEFFHEVKGGDQNFSPQAKGGTKIFCHRQRGGPEKNGDRPSQTDGPPSR